VSTPAETSAASRAKSPFAAQHRDGRQREYGGRGAAEEDQDVDQATATTTVTVT
jgi:hypothetical protein